MSKKKKMKIQFTICCHLKKIGKVSRLGIWLPQTLSENNEEDRISTATSLLSKQNNDTFLKNIMTGHEKWVIYDNVQRKRQWIDEDISLQPNRKVEFHGNNG